MKETKPSPLIPSLISLPKKTDSFQLEMTDREVIHTLRQTGFHLHKNGIKESTEQLRQECEKLKEIKRRLNENQSKKEQEKHFSIQEPKARLNTPATAFSQFQNQSFPDDLLFDAAFPGEYLEIRKNGFVVGTSSYNVLMARSMNNLGNVFYIMDKLYNIVLDYDIQLAQVDCEKIKRLSNQLLYFNLHYHDILNCFTKPDELRRVMHVPGQRFKGRYPREAASIKIQSVFRMFREKCKYKRYWELKYVARVFGIFWLNKMERRRVDKAFRQRYDRNIYPAVMNSRKMHMDNYVLNSRKRQFNLVYLIDVEGQLMISLLRLYEENVYLGFVVHPSQFSYFRLYLETLLLHCFLDAADKVMERIYIYKLDDEIANLNISDDLKLLSSTKCLREIRAHVKTEFDGALTTFAESHLNRNTILISHFVGLTLLANDIKQFQHQPPSSFFQGPNQLRVEIGLWVTPFSYEVKLTCQTIGDYGILAPQVCVDIKSLIKEYDSVIQAYQKKRYYGWISFFLAMEPNAKTVVDIDHQVGLSRLLQKAVCIEMIANCRYQLDINMMCPVDGPPRLPFNATHLAEVADVNMMDALNEFNRDSNRKINSRVGLYFTGIRHGQITKESRNGIMAYLQRKFPYDPLTKQGTVFPMWEPILGKDIPIIMIDQTYVAAFNRLGDIMSMLDLGFTIDSIPFETNFQDAWNFINMHMVDCERMLVFKKYMLIPDQVVLSTKPKFEIPPATIKLVQQQLASVVLQKSDPTFKTFTKLSQINHEELIVVTPELMQKLKDKEDKIQVNLSTSDSNFSVEYSQLQEKESMTDQTKIVERRLMKAIDRSELCDSKMEALIDQTKVMILTKNEEYRMEIENRKEIKRYLKQKMSAALATHSSKVAEATQREQEAAAENRQDFKSIPLPEDKEFDTDKAFDKANDSIKIKFKRNRNNLSADDDNENSDTKQKGMDSDNDITAMPVKTNTKSSGHLNDEDTNGFRGFGNEKLAGSVKDMLVIAIQHLLQKSQ